MTKHITLFDTTAEYNNASLDLPNVSYTEDDLKVHYNPYDGRLICKYNVTTTSGTTKMLNDSSNVSAIEIDGVTLGSVYTHYPFSTTGEHTIKYTLTDNTSINNGMFDNCTHLTNVAIPSSVTSISQSAFCNCSGLTSVAIPDSVTSIGNYTFSQCSSLTSVTIPSSVTNINTETFSNCSNLTNIIIPSSVTRIGDEVFYGCSGLTTLIVQATTPPTLGGGTLNNTNANLVIKVPSASVNAYKAASGWSTYASKIQAI